MGSRGVGGGGGGGSAESAAHHWRHEQAVHDCTLSRATIGLSACGSRSQAKDHGLMTVQRCAYPTEPHIINSLSP